MHRDCARAAVRALDLLVAPSPPSRRCAAGAGVGAIAALATDRANWGRACPRGRGSGDRTTAAATGGRRPQAINYLRPPARVLLVLGAAAFFTLLAEAQPTGAPSISSDSVGATGRGRARDTPALRFAMATSRSVGDRLNTASARSRSRAGGLEAASGLTLALFTGWVPTALPGFAAMGAGIGAVVPVLFRAAGSTPAISAGAGIAAVSTIGWLGSFRPAGDRFLPPAPSGYEWHWCSSSWRSSRWWCWRGSVLARLGTCGLPIEPRVVLSDLDGCRRFGAQIEATWRAFWRARPRRGAGSRGESRAPHRPDPPRRPQPDADVEAAELEREEAASADGVRALPGRESSSVRSVGPLRDRNFRDASVAVARLRAAGIRFGRPRDGRAGQTASLTRPAICARPSCWGRPGRRAVLGCSGRRRSRAGGHDRYRRADGGDTSSVGNTARADLRALLPSGNGRRDGHRHLFRPCWARRTVNESFTPRTRAARLRCESLFQLVCFSAYSARLHRAPWKTRQTMDVHEASNTRKPPPMAHSRDHPGLPARGCVGTADAGRCGRLPSSSCT